MRDRRLGWLAAEAQRWVPAVNNYGGLGRWALVEIKDPWDAKSEIRREPGEAT